jgi:hypothetical protein
MVWKFEMQHIFIGCGYLFAITVFMGRENGLLSKNGLAKGLKPSFIQRTLSSQPSRAGYFRSHYIITK